MGLAWKPAAQEMTVKLQGLAMGRKREAEFRRAPEAAGMRGPASPLRAAELSPPSGETPFRKGHKGYADPSHALYNRCYRVGGASIRARVQECGAGVKEGQESRGQEVRESGSSRNQHGGVPHTQERCQQYI
jgi:hypothetical protein